MPRTFLVRRSNEGKRQSPESVNIGELTTDVKHVTSEINIDDVNGSITDNQSQSNTG